MSPRLSVVLSTLGNHAGLRAGARRLRDPGRRPRQLRGARGLRPRRARARGRRRRRSASAPTRCGVLRGRDPRAVGKPQRGLARGRGAARAVHRQRHDPRARGWSPSTSPGTRASRRRRSAVLGHVRWAREVRVTPFMHWLDHGVQFDYPAIDGTEAGWGRFYGANVVGQARARSSGSGASTRSACPTATRTSTSATAPNALGPAAALQPRRGRRAPARVRPAVLQAAGAAARAAPSRVRRQAPRARAVVLPHVQLCGAPAARLGPRPPPDPPRRRARPR